MCAESEQVIRLDHRLLYNETLYCVIAIGLLRYFHSIFFVPLMQNA